MSLLRRRIRKRLLGANITGRRLDERHVQSHVNGSVTVAVNYNGAYTLDDLERQVRSYLQGYGYGGLLTLRKSFAQGGRTIYVTLTSRELVEEAEDRYGSSPIRGLLVGLEAGYVAAEAEVAAAPEPEVVVMDAPDLTEEFEFPEIELEAAEMSEV